MVEVCLGAVLLIWISSPENASALPFGRYGSVAALLVVIVTGAIGILGASISRRSSMIFRWGVAMPVVVGASLLVALAIMDVFADRNGVWILLGYAAVGMCLVAWDLSRAKTASRPPMRNGS